MNRRDLLTRMPTSSTGDGMTLLASELNEEEIKGRRISNATVYLDEDLYLLPSDRYEGCKIQMGAHRFVMLSDSTPTSVIDSCEVFIEAGNPMLVDKDGTPLPKATHAP